MMKYNLLILIVCFLFKTECIVAQSAVQGYLSAYNAISIGDEVPDLVFTNLVNTAKKEIKLSDLKGKLVLLDFWATSCGSCIAAFPKLDSLQQKYRDKLQIILVGSKFGSKIESKEKVQTFFNRWEQRNNRKLNLPHDAGSEVANALFPHQKISHVAWIGIDGTVKAITGSSDVTAKNIEAILNNEKVLLRVKKDVDYNWDTPLFVNGNGGDGKTILFHSLLTNYTEGIGGTRVSTLPDNPGLVTAITSLNSSIPQLYQDAIPEVYTYTKNRFILDGVKDVGRYFGDFKSYQWIKDNLYCYELVAPPTVITDTRKMMKEDLDKYLGLKTGIELRTVKCLVIKSIGDTTKALSKGGEPDTNIEENTGNKFLKNMPLHVLIRALDRLLPYPVIDESSFLSSVDMALPADLSDIQALQQHLAKYGFGIEEQQRQMNMFIIKEIR